jgi:2-oxoglutarate dehydrogenase E2 component (dihydrolipoamide succinyltransferase)
MTAIKVPPLGESITEATVSRWLKNEGDPVAVGETLVELDTDKITVEVPAMMAGVLTKRAHAEGDVVKVDDFLAEIDENAAPAAGSPAPAPQQKAPAPQAAAPTSPSKPAPASPPPPAGPPKTPRADDGSGHGPRRSRQQAGRDRTRGAAARRAAAAGNAAAATDATTAGRRRSAERAQRGDAGRWPSDCRA